MTDELKGNDKVWIRTVDDVDVYHMSCPLDCGCIAVCMMSWAPGVPYEANCALCGDVTEIAWSEGGEE